MQVMRDASERHVLSHNGHNANQSMDLQSPAPKRTLPKVEISPQRYCIKTLTVVTSTFTKITVQIPNVALISYTSNNTVYTSKLCWQ